MACFPPSSGAGVAGRSRSMARGPEHGSGAGPASARERQRGDEQAWPLGSYLELGALPSAVPCARLHAKQVIWEWNLDGLTETIELIVSELVTNAQRASASLTGSRYRGQRTPGVPPVRLWLRADTDRVLIQVWDADHHLPEPQSPDLAAEGGRGLLLVETLSADWGAYLLEGSSGKVVWAIASRAYP
jgi:hypothetical protein